MKEYSFAIFSVGGVTLDLHINVWIDLNKVSYIEFGFRLYDFINFEKVGVYIPYVVKKEEIEDLFDYFKKDSVARGIFNQEFTVKSYTEIEGCEYTFPHYSMNFFPVRKTLKELRNLDEFGTILYFSVDKNYTDKRTYFRFRIPYKNNALNIKKEKHDYLYALESPLMHERIQHIFRINENRTIPSEVLKMIKSENGSIAGMHKIKYFIIAPETIQISGEDITKERVVEKELFVGGYLPYRSEKEEWITYQYIYDERENYLINSFLERKYINWLSSTVYAVVILILNIISSFIFKYIAG